ncbi:PREDICTED: uncharacterized protein LOC107192371 [Dufourea novaeangliae]|uniref:uncharacterized protein LOC107192371 n=1 Tax=Dufourea novaeangliae TaxID=178035 RepID=UPI0007672D5A|nr:PREDICTED: uncharacterized protein LOC107192371 [Dufourea novaeangliae]
MIINLLDNIMTVSNPLIKELKGWTRKLTECNTEIDDAHVDLPSFCKCLETCLQKGILMSLTTVGFSKLPDAWFCLEEIAEKHFSSSCTYSLIVEQVKQNLKVQTPNGRLRQLIRTCLMRKCLHMPIEILVRTPLMAIDYYDKGSILGDEILGEILFSVLLQVSKLNFKLNLRNSSFLDESWQLPECVALELVPCKSLGISVCFTKGKALIINLDRNSVAAEDDKVEVGDVLDEINGCAITSNTKGQLGKIMRKTVGQPVCLYIIKYHNKQTQEMYSPIVNLVRNSGIERLKKILKRPISDVQDNEETSDISKMMHQSLNAGFSIKYCGSVCIGTEGDVKQIEKAILQVLKSKTLKLIPVKFECLEIGIRVTGDMNDKVICKQSYMEISSCGCTMNIPDYFAFIARDTNCSLATKFDAYVFYHKNENEVQTILQSLGQGFQRTHFVV